MGAAADIGGRLPVNYWLPPSDEERRAGFYVCNEMLQLMEDVFLEFDLDQYHDHIDNRGWMNLFQHWAWSGMLCATWAITGSTFDPRFQRFCRIAAGPARRAVPAWPIRSAALTLPAGRRLARAWTPTARRGRTWPTWQDAGRAELLGGRAAVEVPAAPRATGR